MALLYIDSFDHYATAELGSKWNVLSGSITSQLNIEAATGRFESCLRLGGSNATGTVGQTLAANEATVIMGGAVKHGSLAAADPVYFFQMLDGTTQQIGLRLLEDNTGRLVLARGSTVIATSANNVISSAGVWYYIEMKVVFDGAAGSIAVRVNGVEVLTFSGDTTQTANNYANIIGLSGYRSQSNYVRVDDFYICEGTDSGIGGIPNNDFLGDCRVEWRNPDGNGTTSQLTGSDGNSTDNYLLVDDTAIDGDTTYVESNTVDQKDTYTYQNLTPTTGTVFGVQIVPWARKTDAGSRSLKTVARHSATEVDSSAFPLSTTYDFYPDIRQSKPGGGSWSISDVNGAEYGVKVA